MIALARTAFLEVTFADVVLLDVLQARGEITADQGWPRCSVFLTTYPHDDLDAPIDEENPIVVVAGAGNNVTRFTGRVRRFRPSMFPKSIELVATGTLAYADEWSPDQDYRMGYATDGPDWHGMFPSGATDQQLVQFALDHVPNVTYSSANIDGTSLVLGQGYAQFAFDWKAGTSAWTYIQSVDRATLYRTYQTQDGTIRRVKMIGHPNNTPDFTLTPDDMLEGAAGSRDTERTRNAVEVRGYNYGGNKQMLGSAYQSNSFQGDGSDPATRHVEVFSSQMIQSGHDRLGNPWTLGGLDADAIAAEIILDVNKEFVEAQVPSWRDDTHGPGMTALLEGTQPRLAIEGPMWVVRYQWQVDDNGWQATYSLTGGGLPQDYTPPPV